MTTNSSASAMNVSIPVKNMPSGLLSASGTFDYVGAAITASANALRVYVCKIPHGAYITGITEAHSSGAATCPVDIGIEVTSGTLSLSAFASAVTLGVTNVVSPLKLPFRVSCPDTQVTQYAKIVAGVTPGTATSAIQIAVMVNYCMDGLPDSLLY